MLKLFDYVKISAPLNSDLQARVERILCDNGKEATFTHVCAVADAAVRLAEKFGLDAEVCRTAGLLHDISAVIKPADMLAGAEEKGWYIDEAERKYPFLLHQRVSKVVAEEDFGITDPRVLSAIEVHTTLKKDFSAYDLAVFLADKIAWDRGGEPPYRVAVEAGLALSLEAAALAYIDFVMENGMILHPHAWLLEAREHLQKAMCEK